MSGPYGKFSFFLVFLVFPTWENLFSRFPTWKKNFPNLRPLTDTPSYRDARTHLKMVILKYVFMFKVKYEPLRDLRLRPNFTEREGIMSPRCPPKFSNLAPLSLKLLTNKIQKTELLELFGRFEVKYWLLRHLVFKWNLTWCQLKVLTMSCTSFSGLCQLLGEI